MDWSPVVSFVAGSATTWLGWWVGPRMTQRADEARALRAERKQIYRDVLLHAQILERHAYNLLDPYYGDPTSKEDRQRRAQHVVPTDVLTSQVWLSAEPSVQKAWADLVFVDEVFDNYWSETVGEYPTDGVRSDDEWVTHALLAVENLKAACRGEATKPVPKWSWEDDDSGQRSGGLRLPVTDAAGRCSR
jgi:hypothetical protein